MRVLVVGAGAIGGYFGGRMLQAGRDVMFLVRPKRAGELASAGLVIKSPNGDVTLKSPPTVLNGMRHLDVLDQKFGRERVLGGLCGIAVTLNERREVVQLHPMQSLAFGERDGQLSDRVRGIAEVMASGKFGSAASEHIMHDMWEKWVFLASLAAATSLMRASVGNILAAPSGKDFMLGMLDECSAVATAEGYAPRAPFLERSRGMLLTEGSQLTASMYRDIKAGAPVEADHVIGDLMMRGDASKVPVPRLRIAYTHLKAYENQRG
jgi:2-dehydropantoate 2-reductase